MLAKHDIFTYKEIKKNYVYHMEKSKNMAQILMFLYSLIIFISLLSM